MKNIYHLLRLNVSLSKNKSGKSDFVSVIFSTLIYGTIIGLLVMFFVNLVTNFETVGAEFELLVFLLFFVLFTKIAFGMILCLKVFFSNAQNEILARLPFSSFEIFVSRLIYVFIVQLFFGFALLLPLLNIYGYLLLMPMSFYIAIPFVVLLSNFVALLISIILSFGAAYIKSFLSNKFALTLIVIAAGFSVSFLGYMRVLNAVTDISSSIEFRINNDIIEVISRLSAVMHPNIFLSNILFFERVWTSIFFLLLMIAVLLAIVYILVRFAYSKMLGKKVGELKTYVGRGKKNQQNILFLALLKREFVSIFRNTGFLFQYFALLIITPLITFLSVQSSAAIATGQIGDIAQNVVTLLVLSIFSVIGSSFATNSISREGASFYLLKTTPLDCKKIITSKFVLSAIATFLSLLISVIVLVAFGYIEIGSMFLLLFYTVAFSIGNICFAIKADLQDPQLQENMGVAHSDKAAVISLTSGLLMAILISGIMLLGVAFSYAILSSIVLGVLIVFYATSGVFFLYRNLDNKFKNIII